jgi:uncharacterized membrane-anchored protein
MKRTVTVVAIAAAQLALVGVGVWPQLSARTLGDPYVVRVAPLDPIDPFRGAYVALSYPDLQHGTPEEWERQPLGTMDDSDSGAVYLTLVEEGNVWVADEWSRERPGGQAPYLSCDDRSWQIRCGIESYFLPQEDAAAAEVDLADGAYAELRVDGRGNASVVDVRETP